MPSKGPETRERSHLFLEVWGEPELKYRGSLRPTWVLLILPQDKSLWPGTSISVSFDEWIDRLTNSTEMQNESSVNHPPTGGLESFLAYPPLQHSLKHIPLDRKAGDHPLFFATGIAQQ